MIPLDKMLELSTLSAEAVTAILRSTGYSDIRYDSAVFKGIGPGCDFCYLCEYREHGVTETCWVYVTYDHETGVVTADW